MVDAAEAGTVTERIIERFGGIRPMAAKLDTPVTTVQGWKKRGIIPLARHPDILAAAAREGLTLDAEELAATDPTPARPERPPETIILPPPPSQSEASQTQPPPAPASSGQASWGQASPASPTSTQASSPQPPPMPPPNHPASAPRFETVVVRRGGAAAYAALLLSLLTLVAVAGGDYAAWHLYLRPLQARVAALEAHGGGNGDLDARIAKLEGELAPGHGRPAETTEAQPGAAAPDSGRLAAIEQQLADLKAGAAQSAQIVKGLSDLQVAAGGRELLAQSIRDIQSTTAATQGEVDRLAKQVTADGTRLDAAEVALAERRQQGLRAEAVILGVGQLRAALATSRPYVRELTALRALAAGDPEIVAQLDLLQPSADNGVPTPDDLSKEFNRLAPDIVRSAVVSDGQSWWRQALYHLESVISIRRVGDSVPGDEVDAIVARAEGKLEEEDVQGAIAGLGALSGLSAEVASPWMAEAQQRVAADQAEAELTRLAIARVSAGNPQVQPAGQPAAVPSAPPAPPPNSQPAPQ